MNNDLRIKNLLEKVSTQLQDLGNKPKANWKTNGIFSSHIESGKFININAVNDKETIIHSLAYILNEAENCLYAADILDMGSDYVFKINGYTLDEYIHDFKLKASIINWENKRKKLLETEKKLKSLVSEESRTAMELDDISETLK